MFSEFLFFFVKLDIAFHNSISKYIDNLSTSNAPGSCVPCTLESHHFFPPKCGCTFFPSSLSPSWTIHDISAADVRSVRDFIHALPPTNPVTPPSFHSHVSERRSMKSIQIKREEDGGGMLLLIIILYPATQFFRFAAFYSRHHP